MQHEVMRKIGGQYSRQGESDGPCISSAHILPVIEQAVSTVFRVPSGELRARTRCQARIAFARQVAMYLAHVAYGLSLTEVGVLFGRDRTTVAHACGVVEDRRDDPAFDTAMEHLESSIVVLANAVRIMDS